MLILRHADVRQILDGQERLVADVVEKTYKAHDEGRTALPHSIFLRFPDAPRDRIIGLPAFVGGDEPATGMKWISSFPGNLEQGLERASAAIILNEAGTGRPAALVEGSVISAKRTAASAAVAARLLTAEPDTHGAALIGCGVINLEVLRFLRSELPGLRRVTVHDQDPARAELFARRAAELTGLGVTVADTAGEALAAHRLVSLATTAAAPHLDLAPLATGSTVLHVSLRDIKVEDILAAQNVTDDTDHVSREQTSIHLAEQATGNRDFVDAEIGRILRDPASFRRDPARTLVYSPFGLGALDIALAARVHAEAAAKGLGVEVEGFLPGETRPS
ncbi:2,3-diaminopropionate biosynthesis protein SbnB (plasmid) [Streptomyces sp. NBC_00335]|uniref:2,3-diaminopropionate biosynthesis protein SbnB n=1 Tax=unclassified Streptomyces TaxID=2593676 RepID=UPI0022597F4C|nr:MULTISPECIES: 2,3-diaminopropionate biosynthesis protein SbnB [unclassified Streptomyces]MCX5410109.1 2,3-diaminopropionate biosynthesis protein SbnB [Streptomyces sp. NBC_00086]